ncbi:GTP-binding protein Rit2-like [Mytilus californianus]|uniref:GTP-binding protein Rit2-like n=1 Tax=Mytilus californianus TaxID=6549 RepID=UPI0022471F5C|nr:GTP-binding protein Rit2-like [Mytilus californianus]
MIDSSEFDELFQESVSPVKPCLQRSRLKSRSEPNSPAGSFKRKLKVKQLIDEENRRNSLPVPIISNLSSSCDDILNEKRRPIRRFRSSKLISGGITGIEDKRDSYASLDIPKDLERRRLSSETSEDSAICCGCSSTCLPGYYRVCVIGADAVGKRTLINKFMCSDVMTTDGDDGDRFVTVVIDNEESTLEFVNFSEDEDQRYPVDAYIVVFSVYEKSSYDIACRFLQCIRNDQFSDRPIILVANKVDLVRKRQITKDEARNLASKFNCKYIETSATLNIKVDKLLLGILKQIKIKLQPEVTESCELSTKGAIKRGSIGLLSRLFHLKPKVKVNSDDVFAL